MHQLRHAAIDQVRRETGDVEIARLLARHENVQVTQDSLHTNPVEELRDAITGRGRRMSISVSRGQRDPLPDLT